MSRNEVRALIDKAKESLGAAQEILRDGYDDFAASRAYYAMFYVAEALLLLMGQSHSKHSAVVSAFGREYAKGGILDPKFHRWLIDAQDPEDHRRLRNPCPCAQGESRISLRMGRGVHPGRGGISVEEGR